MQLTLHDQWAIDSAISREIIFRERFNAVMFGAISAEFSVKNENIEHFSRDGQWISARLLRLFDSIISGKGDAETTMKNSGVSQIALLAPIAFALGDTFDFPLLVKTVEKYTENIRHDGQSVLACIIYIEILFRLLHNDDFERAIGITNELCGRYLGGTVYEKELPRYETAEAGMGGILKAALRFCLLHASFEDTIKAAAQSTGDAAEIAVLTGTMAGLFYKPRIPDSSNKLI